MTALGRIFIPIQDIVTNVVKNNFLKVPFSNHDFSTDNTLTDI